MRPLQRAPFVLAALASLLAALLLAPAASASFHLIKVREVYPGGAEDSYVELQMYAAGQDFLGGHALTVYDAAGNLAHTSTFVGSVANGQNQRTALIGDTGVEASFGVKPDLIDAGLALGASGAVCWNAGGLPADCVAWGGFSGKLSSPVGTPATLSAGSALRRTISRACPTFLEEADDTDDSAADLLAVAPMPLPNSAIPAEKACAGGGSGGGGAGGGGHANPQTILKGKPAKRTRDRTPTFRFRSDHADASFQCALDKQRFRPCRSPFTTKRLAVGPHTFRVRAREDSGDVDSSPASFSFRILPPRR